MSVDPVIVGEIGSYAHGLAIDTSDHDYMGVYIDPAESLIGLKPGSGAVRDRDKPEGVKSEAGDSEATYYSLRKYASLAAQGNPTVMTLLFTPTLKVPDEIGLQDNRNMFLSKRLAARHIGYAEGMRRRLMGDKAPRTKRPELVAAHGFDTKAAFHAIRLLIQGHEMLMWGTMTMPMLPVQASHLLSIRNGEVPMQAVLNEIESWREKIGYAEMVSKLPEEPDYARIDRWLIDTHMGEWGWMGWPTGTPATAA